MSNHQSYDTASDTARSYISVLVVDDQQIIRSGLKTLLQADNAIRVVGEARNGWEAIEQTQSLHPDIILMDIQMPGMSGIEATTSIKTAMPNVQIIMVTSYSSDNYILEAVRAGAVGYLLKDSSQELLCETVRKAYAGHFLIKSEILRQALSGIADVPKRVRAQPGTPTRQLSGREIEVVRLVSEGFTNRQISVQLAISEETVKKHVQTITTKLGALDRTHAAVKAVRFGLVS